jgi:hypothetical protein
MRYWKGLGIGRKHFCWKWSNFSTFGGYCPALTTFALCSNQIGDQVAEHLANALQQNRVTPLVQIFFLFNS